MSREPWLCRHFAVGGRGVPPAPRPRAPGAARTARALIVLTALAAAASGPSVLPAGSLAAQSVEGVVRDSQQRPLAATYIALLDEDRESVSTMVTDDQGRFEIRAPVPGSYYLYINRLGFRSLVDGLYTLREGDPLEVWVVMHPDPIRLEGVTGVVEGRVQRLASVGFYERKEAGFGHFVEREELRHLIGSHVTDAFLSVPGMTVHEPLPSLIGPGALIHPQLLVRRGGRSCSPTLYVDGAEVHRGGVNSGALRPDDFLHPEDLEAIEVYAGAAATPLQYQSRSPCGLVLIWTRHTPPIR